MCVCVCVCVCVCYIFELANKLYTYSPEFVLEQQKHKILWDFKMQMYQQILTRRSEVKNWYKLIRIEHVVISLIFLFQWTGKNTERKAKIYTNT